MDEPIKILNESQCKRKKRKKRGKKKSKNHSKSTFGNLSLLRLIKENHRKKMRLSKQCLGSIVEDLYERQMSFVNEDRQKSLVDMEHWENDLLEQTIDLCDGDSSVDSPGSSVVTVPSAAEGNEIVVVDLSDDFPKQKEIIDLTETGCAPVSDLQPVIDVQHDLQPCITSCQPDAIDVNNQVSKEEPKSKSDNDNEIFVIGTFTRTCHLDKKPSSPDSYSNRWSNYRSLVTCSEKLKRKYLKKPSVFDRINNKKSKKQNKGKHYGSCKNLTRVGENVYVNSPVTLPSSGLRPIIIDGSNVAFVHSSSNFSCKRLEICINYFKEKGHKVTAFVPQFRLKSHRSDDPELLRRLEKRGDVVLTPSKKIDGRNIVPYDDRFIVQTAVLKGGIIVTRDNYNDLLKENPAWAETIKYRTLAFTWVDDVLMFPKDPLGEFGPTLEQFLRFH